ncbi:MAG: ferritin-like domain-containing protein [Myxococcota bacterium]
MLDRLHLALDRAVRTRIFSQPPAKAFALSAYANAESGGEGRFFDYALARVTEARLRRMIERHRDDEVRHAALFAERRVALGLPEVPVPAELETVGLLSAAAGGILDRPARDDGDVAEAFALLLVVEERALALFDRSARVCAALGDLETAALFTEIGADERRHLRYCEVIGREMVGEADFAARVARLRVLEARVYGEQSRGILNHLLDRGWLTLPWWLEALVRVRRPRPQLALAAPQ